MSRITEDHRIFAHLPDADLYDTESDEDTQKRLQPDAKAPLRTYWPTCKRCLHPFPATSWSRTICGSCRMSEHEL